MRGFRRRAREEPVTLDEVTVVRETDKALLVVIGDADDPEADEVWIPKSQIDASSEIQKKGDEGTLTISHWLATEKDLI